MAEVFLLPVRTDLGVYSFRVDLQGTLFTLRFRFSPRDDHWYFDLFDIDGLALRQGLRAVSNWSLLRLLVQQGRPAGDIIMSNPASDADPDRVSLQVDSWATYIEGSASSG